MKLILQKALSACVLTLLLASCAHTQKEAASSSTGTVVAQPKSAQPSAKLEVPLPYTFTRRGVDIRANSVEVANNQIKVSLSLRETRNAETELLAAKLVEVHSASGQSCAYQGWSRSGGMNTTPEIALKAGEHFSIEVIFQRPAGALDPLQVLFPSGKWWSGAP